MEEKNPVFTDRALSSEAQILWGLSNFFLQLFLWGLPTGLFLFWTATFWEGFFVLAFLTGVAGIIVAVVPLWVILYPKERNNQTRRKEDLDPGKWVALFFAVILGGLIIGVILIAAFSNA